MVSNQKVTGRAMPMPAGIGLGVGVSAGTTLAGAMALAWLVHKETLAEPSIGYGVMLLVLLSAWAGALIAARRIKRRRMTVCLLTGLGYYVTLLAVTALFFGGQYRGMGVTALLALTATAAAGLLGLKREDSRKNKVRKYRSR